MQCSDTRPSSFARVSPKQATTLPPRRSSRGMLPRARDPFRCRLYSFWDSYGPYVLLSDQKKRLHTLKGKKPHFVRRKNDEFTKNLHLNFAFDDLATQVFDNFFKNSLCIGKLKLDTQGVKMAMVMYNCNKACLFQAQSHFWRTGGLPMKYTGTERMNIGR